MAAPDASSIVASLLTATRWWGGSTITYSIPREGSTWPGYGAGEEPSGAGYGVMNSAQRLQFTAAVQTWDRLIASQFVQTDDLTSPGQIRVAFTNVDAVDDDDDGDAEENALDAGEDRPELGMQRFADRNDERGTDEGSPDGSDAAEHGDGERLRRDQHAEHGNGRHDQEQDRIE